MLLTRRKDQLTDLQSDQSRTHPPACRGNGVEPEKGRGSEARYPSGEAVYLQILDKNSVGAHLWIGDESEEYGRR